MIQHCGLEDDDERQTRYAQELAFLANALAAGCTLHDRMLAAREAEDAAAAICNLGLEQPSHAHGVTDSLVHHFQIGWTALYERIVVVTAQRLLDALHAVDCGDDEVRMDLAAK